MINIIYPAYWGKGCMHNVNISNCMMTGISIDISKHISVWEDGNKAW